MDFVYCVECEQVGSRPGARPCAHFEGSMGRIQLETPEDWEALGRIVPAGMFPHVQFEDHDLFSWDQTIPARDDLQATPEAYGVVTFKEVPPQIGYSGTFKIYYESQDFKSHFDQFFKGAVKEAAEKVVKKAAGAWLDSLITDYPAFWVHDDIKDDKAIAQGKALKGKNLNPVQGFVKSHNLPKFKAPKKLGKGKY